MGQSALDQCVTSMPGRSMHNQTRRFIDHQQLLVLIGDLQSSYFTGLTWPLVNRLGAYEVAQPDFVGRF